MTAESSSEGEGQLVDAAGPLPRGAVDDLVDGEVSASEVAPGFSVAVGGLGDVSDGVLDALLAVVPDLVFRVHRDGSVLGMWAGPGHRIPADGIEYFRYLAERSALTVSDLLSPDLADRVMKVVDEVLDTGDPRVLEYRHLVLGRPRVLQGRCARSGPDEVVWLSDDITAEVETRQQLEEHEARYHAVVETLDEAIVLHDHHGTPYAMNRAAAQLFGTLDGGSPASQAFSGPDVHRIDEDGNERLPENNPVMVTLRTGESQRGKVIGFARTGHPTRWLSVTTRLMETGVDRPVNVVSTSVDITDERARREREAQRVAFDALVSTSSAALLGAPADQLDQVSTATLQRLAEHFDADVAFVGEFRTPEVFELHHDWRRPGSPPRRDPSRRSRMGQHVSSFESLQREGLLLVRSTDDLPADATYERTSMTAGGDHAFAWVTIGPVDRPAGFLGLAWKRHSYDGPRAELLQLGRVGEAMLLALTRRRLEQLNAGQRRVLELIGTGAPLGEALEAVARLRQGGGGDVRSAVLLVDSSGTGVTLGAGPDLDDAMRAHLERRGADLDSPIADAIRTRTATGIGAGMSDAYATFAAELRELGIVTMSAAPIVSSQTGHAVGAIATYDLDPDPVALVDPALDQACTDLAAIAIERATDVAELSHQATHDALTGAANRVALLDRLEQALVRARAHGTLVAVLFCDLDRFKDVNDRFGHALGDQLLREVARRITEVVDLTDTVSRFGGDEFVLLCDDLRDEEHALQVADRVAHAVGDAPFSVGGVNVNLTTSIGVAFSTPTADHPEALVRDADVAMYRAKASGRDRREVFHESIRRAARDRDVLAQELAEAIRHGGLELHYQPIVSVQRGGVEGLEALVRWPHATRGMLAPGSFIPVAEETGLIVPLGRWVAEEALRQLDLCAAADDRWRDLLMHVNVSARQLSEHDYVDHLTEVIERAAVRPDRVVLEITESVLMADSPASRSAIHGLHESGARLVLDDFGTGYASLTYLRRFPLSGIKVDRSFVAGLGIRADDDAIVRSVIELGRSLELDVVAEGVETADQALILRELGCRTAQGFHFARPQPAAKLLDVMRALDAAGPPAATPPAAQPADR